MRRRYSPGSRHGRRIALVVVPFLLVAIVSALGLWAMSGRANSIHTGAISAASAPAPSVPETPAADPIQDAAVRQQLEQMRAMPVPSPDRALRDRIPAEARSHPDVYAAQFVSALLTQDFRRPRSQLLSWVAAEAVTTNEPLVVGLVPVELRDRLALFSVTEESDGPGSSPIPSPAEWTRLGALDAYTTVADIRVSEPLAWSNAVDAGRITDPGITARQVTATVTLHRTDSSRPSTTRYSVSLTADFEGPPTRPSWGFVNVVLYTSLKEGAS